MVKQLFIIRSILFEYFLKNRRLCDDCDVKTIVEKKNLMFFLKRKGLKLKMVLVLGIPRPSLTCLGLVATPLTGPQTTNPQ